MASLDAFTGFPCNALPLERLAFVAKRPALAFAVHLEALFAELPRVVAPSLALAFTSLWLFGRAYGVATRRALYGYLGILALNDTIVPGLLQLWVSPHQVTTHSFQILPDLYTGPLLAALLMLPADFVIFYSLCTVIGGAISCRALSRAVENPTRAELLHLYLPALHTIPAALGASVFSLCRHWLIRPLAGAFASGWACVRRLLRAALPRMPPTGPRRSTPQGPGPAAASAATPAAKGSGAAAAAAGMVTELPSGRCSGDGCGASAGGGGKASASDSSLNAAKPRAPGCSSSRGACPAEPLANSAADAVAYPGCAGPDAHSRFSCDSAKCQCGAPVASPIAGGHTSKSCCGCRCCSSQQGVPQGAPKGPSSPAAAVPALERARELVSRAATAEYYSGCFQLQRVVVRLPALSPQSLAPGWAESVGEQLVSRHPDWHIVNLSAREGSLIVVLEAGSRWRRPPPAAADPSLTFLSSSACPVLPTTAITTCSAPFYTGNPRPLLQAEPASTPESGALLERCSAGHVVAVAGGLPNCLELTPYASHTTALVDSRQLLAALADPVTRLCPDRHSALPARARESGLRTARGQGRGLPGRDGRQDGKQQREGGQRSACFRVATEADALSQRGDGEGRREEGRGERGVWAGLQQVAATLAAALPSPDPQAGGTMTIEDGLGGFCLFKYDTVASTWRLVSSCELRPSAPRDPPGRPLPQQGSAHSGSEAGAGAAIVCPRCPLRSSDGGPARHPAHLQPSQPHQRPTSAAAKDLPTPLDAAVPGPLADVSVYPATLALPGAAPAPSPAVGLQLSVRLQADLLTALCSCVRGPVAEAVPGASEGTAAGGTGRGGGVADHVWGAVDGFVPPLLRMLCWRRSPAPPPCAVPVGAPRGAGAATPGATAAPGPHEEAAAAAPAASLCAMVVSPSASVRPGASSHSAPSDVASLRKRRRGVEHPRVAPVGATEVPLSGSKIAVRQQQQPQPGYVSELSVWLRVLAPGRLTPLVYVRSRVRLQEARAPMVPEPSWQQQQPQQCCQAQVQLGPAAPSPVRPPPPLPPPEMRQGCPSGQDQAQQAHRQRLDQGRRRQVGDTEGDGGAAGQLLPGAAGGGAERTWSPPELACGPVELRGVLQAEELASVLRGSDGGAAVRPGSVADTVPAAPTVTLIAEVWYDPAGLLCGSVAVPVAVVPERARVRAL